MNITTTHIGGGHFEFTTLSNPGNTFVLSQMPKIIPYFEKFLIDEQFDLIIEIGTYKGGLTVLLDEIKQNNNLKVKIHTIDIGIWDEAEFSKVLDVFNERQVSFYKVDIFSEEGKSLISKFLKDTKLKVCVLCDGGNKIEEFNYFSQFIKQGDFIMAHDYNHNSDNIDGLTYECSWGWQEINYTDISKSILHNNLQMNTEIRFPEVAWACYKKV
jgi:cephalosporin hydroxylase